VRIAFTAAGATELGQMPVRIGYALAMAAATGAPIRIADNLMDRLAVPAQDDLAAQFSRDVPMPRHRFDGKDPVPPVRAALQARLDAVLAEQDERARLAHA